MKADLYVDDGVAVVRGLNLRSSKSLSGDFVYVSESTAEALASSRLRPFDLVFPHRGSIGEVGIVPDDGVAYILSTSLMKLTCDTALCDPVFVYYYFRSPQGRREILTYASTVGTPGIGQPLASLRAMKLPLPPLAEQRAIGCVLSALDDKIDADERVARVCNELANALLEELLAQASGHGDVQTVRLGDVATVNERSVKRGVGTMRYLDISSVSDGFAAEATVMDWSQAPGRARRGAVDGDVLWSTVRPNRRSHCLVLDSPADLVVSTGFAVLSPTTIGSSFLYGVTDRRPFVDWLESVAEGSAYPAVRAERFAEAPIPMPHLSELAAYEEATMPLRRYAALAIEESRVLARLRDTLLPSLMSGELRVRDDETTVAVAE